MGRGSAAPILSIPSSRTPASHPPANASGPTTQWTRCRKYWRLFSDTGDDDLASGDDEEEESNSSDAGVGRNSTFEADAD